MTRLGFDGFEIGFVSGAEHSKDDAGLGMRWDFLITRRGLGLVGGGEGDCWIGEASCSRSCFFRQGYFWIVSVQICQISGVFILCLLNSGPSGLYFNF